MTNNRLMQVKSIAECSLEHSAILLTFIELPFVFKACVLYIFEWSLKTGLVVNPITVGNFAFLFNCTPVGSTSDSMMVPT